MRARILVVAMNIAVFALTAAAAEIPSSADSARLPEAEAGLAAKYPGDQGIEKDPSVLFAEGFEGKDLPVAGYGKPGGFYDLQGVPKLMYPTDKEAAVGKQSLELFHPQSVISPQWFHRSFPGQDTVYVRFYRKFEKDWVWPVLGQHDTYLFAGKYNSPAATDLTFYLDVSGVQQKWHSPPTADRRATKNAVVDGVFNMQPLPVLKASYQGPDLEFGIGSPIISHVGWDNYYPLPYNMSAGPVLQGGRWYCIEYMGKLNSPGKRDGQARVWIDGQLITEMGAFALKKDQWTDVTLMAKDLRVGYGDRPADSLAGSSFNNLKMVFNGKETDRFLIDDFSVSTGGKTVYQEQFEGGAGKFTDGDVVGGGPGDSKALSFGPKGFQIDGAFSIPVDDSTTLRFKLKPLCDVDKVTLVARSEKLNANCQYDLCGLMLRDAQHSDIQWNHWMLGPRYGGKAYKEGPPQDQKSWIDGIVVATRYVGMAAR